MVKNQKEHKGNPKKGKEETPITVYALLVILALMGYLAGEIMLRSRPHPFHWLVGLVGGVAGYLAGWFVYRKYGDLFGF